MKEFLFIFRSAVDVQQTPSPEQMQSTLKAWHDWLGGIAAQNKLVTGGNRLMPDGTSVKQGGIVTNGPYVEIKEAVGGYSIIKTESLEDATEIAKGCPIFFINGSVEVREIMSM